MKSTSIEQNINQGLKGRATIQLRSLINDFPNDLNYRDQLGQLYYDSGFLDYAGKYWILNDSKSEHMKMCVELYKNSVKNSGSQILKDIKFRGDKSLLSLYGQKMLAELEQDSFAKTKNIPVFLERKKKERIAKPKFSYAEELKKDLLNIGCYATLIILFIAVVVGLITIYNYLWQ